MSALMLASVYVFIAVLAAAIAWRVSAPEHRWYNLAHWMIGATLTVTLAMLTAMIAFTADCAERTESGQLNLSRCSPTLASWFTVVQSWQQGIGAAVGLLGLGWATHFNAARTR